MTDPVRAQLSPEAGLIDSLLASVGISDSARRESLFDGGEEVVTASGRPKVLAEIVLEHIEHSGWRIVPVDALHLDDALEVHVGKDGQGYWHRQAAGNNEPISNGEGYTDVDGAITGALRANPGFTRDQIKVTA